jgi:hypothetical protein
MSAASRYGSKQLRSLVPGVWTIALTACAAPQMSPTAAPGAGAAAGWPNNFDRVLLSPGRSAVCYTDPCSVYFLLPPGSGTRTVRVNNLLAGTGDEHEAFFVGSYYRYQAPATFTVDGLNVRPAVLWINSRF